MNKIQTSQIVPREMTGLSRLISKLSLIRSLKLLVSILFKIEIKSLKNIQRKILLRRNSIATGLSPISILFWLCIN